MKRGEIWTVSGGPAYTSKGRPAAIVQDDGFGAGDSITLCPFTSDPAVSPTRVLILPTQANGLRQPSMLMADKITTVPRAKLGARIGRLESDDLERVEAALLLFLGLSENGSRERS